MPQLCVCFLWATVAFTVNVLLFLHLLFLVVRVCHRMHVWQQHNRASFKACNEELFSEPTQAATLPGSSKAALNDLRGHLEPIRVYHRISTGELWTLQNRERNTVCNQRMDTLLFPLVSFQPKECIWSTCVKCYSKQHTRLLHHFQQIPIMEQTFLCNFKSICPLGIWHLMFLLLHYPCFNVHFGWSSPCLLKSV